ncbi:hypothetical protein DV721_25930 [Klebsiella pneumoniae]|nr:hypothetical protein [Klebsiella pneumoniae]
MDKRFLRKEGTVWYADFSDSPFPEELAVPAGYIERAKKQITVKLGAMSPVKYRQHLGITT